MVEYHARIDRMKFSTMESIVGVVRRAMVLGQKNPDRDITGNSLMYVNEIIEIVQGDKKMGKSNDKLVSQTFYLVKEALERAVMAKDNPATVSLTAIAEDATAKIVNELFGKKSPMESDLVDPYYEMDPETEDLIDNGRLLLDGMKVLLECPAIRAHVGENMSACDLAEARMKNRWATVTNHKIVSADGRPCLSFIAVYEDGVKRKVTQMVDLAWLVKKDTIPRYDTILNTNGEEKFFGPLVQVLEILKAMKSDELSHYSVKIGETDLSVPGDQYIVCEGEMPEKTIHVMRKAHISDTEVFDNNGLSVMSGTVHDMQNWARSLASDSDYLDYRLRYGGTEKFVKVRDFLVKPVWDGVERDETVFGVLSPTNSLLFEGTKGEVIAFLEDENHRDFLENNKVKFLSESRVFCGSSFGNSVPAIDFFRDNREK